MVDFGYALAGFTAFIARVLNIHFFIFGTFGNFVLVCLLLSLVGFVLRGLWDGGDK